MDDQSAAAMDRAIAAHAAAHEADLARLRQMSLDERGQMIVAACEAAAEIYRSRLAAGLPLPEPEPWPASTWAFLKRNAANARR